MKQPCKVVDSERSAGLWMTRKKDQAILNKNLQLLDKNEKTVVNRITVSQKVVHKRFQWKVYQTKLAHARIVSDRDLERSVRKTHTMALNTNVGNDDEEEEGNMLKKIWSHGRYWIDGVRKGRIRDTAPLVFDNNRTGQQLSRAKSAGARVGQTTPTRDKIPPRPYTAVSIAQATPPVRAATAEGILPKVRIETKSAKGEYIRTSGQGYATEYDPSDHHITIPGEDYELSDLDDIDEDPDDTPRQKPRSKSAKAGGGFLNVIIKDNDRSSRSKSAKAKSDVTADKTRPSIFQEEERPPTLLEIQRERVKSANYEKKVNSFCDVIKPYRTDRGIPDYYMVRLVEGSEYAKGRKRIPPTAFGSECDLTRDLNSMKVRSMTFKTINNYALTPPVCNGINGHPKLPTSEVH